MKVIYLGKYSKMYFDFGEGSVYNADPYDLPYEDSSFDKVVAILYFDNLQFVKWAIQESCRVLKTNGKMIATLSHSISIRRLLGKDYLGQKFLKRKPSQSQAYFKEKTLQALIETLPLKLSSFKSMSVSLGNDQVKFSGSKLGSKLLFETQKCNHSEVLEKYRSYPTSKVEESELFVKLKSRLNQWVEKNPTFEGLKIEVLSKSELNSKRILVLSPHPDDEVIGCGGLVIQAMNQNAIVSMIELMDGRETRIMKADESLPKDIRLKEASDVFQQMTISDFELWGELVLNDENLERLSLLLLKKIKQFRPDWIFLPFIVDDHPDHVYTNVILWNALRQMESHDIDIFSYEVWGQVPINCMINIDDEMLEKMRLLLKFKTAMKAMDYSDYCAGLNSYNHKSQTNTPGFAEVFLKLSSEEWITLCNQEFKDKIAHKNVVGNIL